MFWKFSILIGNCWYTLYHNKKSKQSVRIVFAIAIRNKHQVVIYSVFLKFVQMELPPEAKSVGWVEAGEEVG